MANSGTGQNLGSVLARAAGKGVSAIPGGMAQERQQTLENIMSVMGIQRQIQQEEEHKQAMALGKIKLNIAQAGERNAINFALMSEDDKFQLELDRLQRKAEVLQGFTPSPGGRFSLAGLGGITTPSPISPRALTGDAFLESRFGTEWLRTYKERTGAPKAKTLSAKDTQLKREIFARHNKPTAEKVWAAHISGVDKDKNAWSRYRSVLSQESGGNIFGPKEATPEAKAEAARQSGYSPQYGMTKAEMLRNIDQNFKNGSLTAAEAAKYLAIAERHWAKDNLYDEVLEYYSPDAGK
jgi:hypothetical protein